MAEGSLNVDRAPRRDRKAFECPRCHVFANQTWYVLQREYGDESGYSDSGPWHAPADDAEPNFSETWVPAGGEPIPATIWSQSQCGHCNYYATWRGDLLQFPSGSPAPMAHEDMPPKARELYDEARGVVGISRRAGAALARATLERLLKGLDDSPPKDASLALRIDAIMPSVSSGLGKMLTVIRHVGNKSLHVEEEPDDAVVLVLDESQTELVFVIFSSINALVDELITKPKLADGYLDLIPEKYLENVKGLKREKAAKDPQQ